MEDAPELFVTPESEQSEAVAVSGNVQALLDLMARNPLHREIYLQIIEFCEVRRLLGDVEAMVADCSGFSLTAQTPFRLIANVVDNGGIHWYEVDAQGDEITEERRANLTDDEADDLVEGLPSKLPMRDVRSWSAWLPNVVCVTCSTRRPAALAPIWTLSISAVSPKRSRPSRRSSTKPTPGLLSARRASRCSRAISWTCWNAPAAWYGIRDGRRQGRGVRLRSNCGPRWPFRTW